MEINAGFLIQIILGALLGILIIMFLYKSYTSHHSIPYFILTYICYFLVGSASIISQIIEPILFPRIRFLPIQMMMLGWAILFMFLFLRSLQSVKILDKKFLFCVIIFGFHQISLILINIIDHNQHEFIHNLWGIADLTYNLLAVYTYGWIGLRFYYKNYRTFRVSSTLILIISFAMNLLGYILLSIADTLWFFKISAPFYMIIQIIANSIPIFGLIIILLVYIRDISHFYVNPHNLFVVLIKDESNNLVFSSKYQSPLGKEMFPDKISKILSLIQDPSDSQSKSIHSTISDELEQYEILSFQNEKNSIIIITDFVTQILIRGFKRFLRALEREKILDKHKKISKTLMTEQIVGLLVNNFPFITEVFHQ